MKVKTKKVLLRLFNLIMISFIVLNTITAFGGIGGISKATDVWEDIRNNTDMSNVPMLQLELLLTGLTYVFTLILKIIIVGIGSVLQLIMSGIYSGFEGNNTFKIVTTEDIILAGTENHSNFLSVDFLDIGSDDTIANTFRTSVAQWYYSLRLVAAAGLLVILIYVGVKMVLSTIGKDQARYKEMFIDWVCSVALLFMLHWIIAFVITVNNAMMNGLASNGGDTTGKMLSELASHLFDAGFQSILAAVIYLVLVGQIFKFFILYIKRMITVGFLIMISPLISITYSIDKMGDKKAQALSAWLKELSYNILIQPFHAIIFFSFYDSITSMIDDSIAPYVLSIVILSFMTKAEEIVRHIFHFEARHMGSMKEAASTFGAASGYFQRMGNSVSKAMPKFRQAGGLRSLAPVAFKDLPIGKNSKSKKLLDKKGKKAASAVAGAAGAAGMAGAATEAGGVTPKKTTAQKMKERMQASKEKRKEKAIEKRARKNYDAIYGQGAYDNRKKEANNGVKESDDIVKAEKEKAKNEIIEENVKKTINKDGKGSYEKLKAQEEADKKAGKTTKNSSAMSYLKQVRDEERKKIDNTLIEDITKLDEQIEKKVERKIKSGDKRYKNVKSYEDLKESAENGNQNASNLLKQAENEVVEDNVKKAIDRKRGKGSYEKLKAQEEADKKSGKTVDNSSAMKDLEQVRNEEREKLKRQSAKRTTTDANSNANANATNENNTTGNNANANNNGGGNTTNNNGASSDSSNGTDKKEITGFKKWVSDGFTDMRVKEQWGATKALLQDSSKVASAIALGAFSFGATDSIGTAYAAGQFGYGFTAGILENSSKTVTKDLEKMLEKYIKLNGANVDLDNLTQVLETFKSNEIRGLYGKIEEMQRNLSNDIKKYINNPTERNNVIFDINEAIAKDDGEVDIDEIFEKYFSKSKKAVENEEEIKGDLRNYANMMMQASMAKSINNVESTGLNISSVSQSMTKKLKKVQQKVIVDLNVNQDGNRITASATARGEENSSSTSSNFGTNANARPRPRTPSNNSN